MSSPAPWKVFEPRSGLVRLEKQAWRCLERCRSKLALDKLPLPIPVDEWIERPLKIHFGVQDLSHLGEGVLGAAYIKEREILIDESTLKNEGRFRFTCAHELGHFMLHRRLMRTFHETAEPGTIRDVRVERQADGFAAAFLMPLPLFEKQLLSICDDHSLEPQENLSELLIPSEKSKKLWKEIFLPEIVRRFSVSFQAAVIRCENLRLTDSSDYSLMPRKFAERFLAESLVKMYGLHRSVASSKSAVPQRTLFEA